MRFALGPVTFVLFPAAILLSSIVSAQTVTEVIDMTGDGVGNTLDRPLGIAVDGSGNVFVAGNLSDNVFKISPSGLITEIIEAHA